MDRTDPSIRVLVVEGQTLVREGLRLLIERDEGCTVVGDTGQAAAAAELCAQTDPDVVLIDPTLADLPTADQPSAGLPGAGLLRAIREHASRTRVLVLAGSVDGKLVRDLLGAGASGYLLKSADRRGLMAAIRAVAAGRYSIDPAAASLLAMPAAPDGTGLTPRERDVLRLVVQGRTNKVIAKELEISDGTVRVYLSEILGKLGATNRTEAAIIAVRRGLVDLAG